MTIGPPVILVGGALSSGVLDFPNAVSRTLPGQFHDVDSETLVAELARFLSA